LSPNVSFSREVLEALARAVEQGLDDAEVVESPCKNAPMAAVAISRGHREG
jgi:hypothetical protein